MVSCALVYLTSSPEDEVRSKSREGETEPYSSDVTPLMSRPCATMSDILASLLQTILSRLRYGPE